MCYFCFESPVGGTMFLREITELLRLLEDEKQRVKWGIVIRVNGKREAENLAAYLIGLGFLARYFHDEIGPLYRMEIITDFTLGITTVLVTTTQETFPLRPHHREVLFR